MLKSIYFQYISPSSRPTQLVSVIVQWVYRQQTVNRCTTTSLRWPTSPASTAARASPTKACDTSTALTWLCVGRRWEAVVLMTLTIQFHIGFNPPPVCLQGRTLATCVDNVTESGREVKGYICQSTVVPSDIRTQNMVSSQPFLIGDSLIGIDRFLQQPCAINKSKIQHCNAENCLNCPDIN